MSNVQLKRAVEQAGEELFQLLYQQFESMPGNAQPEIIWTMMAELASKITGVYKLLTRIAEIVPPAISYGGTVGSVEKDTALIQAERMLTGLVHRTKSMRNAAFSDACRDLPLPVKNTDPHSTKRVLHEMLFVGTDCFVELALVQPGKHGRIFVFREELRDWLISTLEPFHVVYKDQSGKTTQYGSYKATLLHGANMIGPEFVQLSDSTREIIVTHISRSNRGSASYESEYQNLALSLKTLPCILLQCVELPPGTYQNPAAHPTISVQNQSRVQPKSTHHLSPRPPGLPVPPVIILKRGSDQGLANLLNNYSAQCSDDTQASSDGPVVRPYAISSAPLSRAAPSAANDSQHTKKSQPARTLSKRSGAKVSTPKARPRPTQPSHNLTRSEAHGPVSFSANANRDIAFQSNMSAAATSICFQPGRYNVGLTKNAAGGAPSAHQNWQPKNMHQNLIQSGGIHRQVVLPRQDPMPLQSGARSNQTNPQYGFQTIRNFDTGFSHKDAPDSARSTQTQVPASLALYRPLQMRGGHPRIQDQNTSPVWFSTEGNLQVDRMYGVPQQHNGGPVLSQSFLDAAGMYGGHVDQNVIPPRFQASAFNFGQRL